MQIERLGPDTLALSGDLDFASFDPLSAALDDLPGAVRLDLSGLTSMDSTGLRLILERLNVGPVTLVGTPPHTMRMIELCGLTEQHGLTFEAGAGSETVATARRKLGSGADPSVGSSSVSGAVPARYPQPMS